jgi:hypothetical protein
VFIAVASATGYATDAFNETLDRLDAASSRRAQLVELR